MDQFYDQDTGEIMNAAPTTSHRWSNPANEIFAALAKAQTEIANAAKDSENPHFRSKYADLASVKEACWGPLTKNGICPVQMPVNIGDGNIGVITLFGHASGQWIESTIFVAPAKFDAQGAGGVITYLRRYALAAMSGVAPEDDDGEAAVGRPQGRQIAPQARRSAGKAWTAPEPPQTATRAPAPPQVLSETAGEYVNQRGAALAAGEGQKQYKFIAEQIRTSPSLEDLDMLMNPDTCPMYAKFLELAKSQGEAIAGPVITRLERLADERRSELGAVYERMLPGEMS